LQDRTFETDTSVTMDEALQMIRAALDDEGLALGPKAGQNDGVTSVLVDGVKIFRVPSVRIVTREDDRSMREIWQRQVAAYEADKTCDGCSHPAHFRACREAGCYCRRRGPSPIQKEATP
jgi:hypothetical protein